jgi:rare lipoprotein A
MKDEVSFNSLEILTGSRSFRIIKTVSGKGRFSSSFFLPPSLFLILFLLSSCATAPPPSPISPSAPSAPSPPARTAPGEPEETYVVFGQTYRVMGSSRGYVETGMASWYGEQFHGQKTSSGEVYDMEKFTAAHRTLPLGTYVKVRRTDGEGESVVVRVNDRGPFVDNRILDLSKGAARQLNMLNDGVAKVTVTALGEEVFRGRSGITLKPRPDYTSGEFSVQVGAFTVRENAQRLAEEAKNTYGSADVSSFDRGDQVFFRVQVGRFASRQEAERFRDRLIGNGAFTSAFVVAK